MIKDLFGILVIVKLVEECSESIDGNKMLHNETLDVIPLNDYKKGVILAQYT